MTVNRVDKDDMVHIYNGILLSHKKERNNASCSNMDGSRDRHTEWSKPEKDKYHILLMCLRAKSLQLRPTLWDPMDCIPPGSSVHESPGKNTGTGYHALPPGDLPNPGIKPTPLTSPALAGRFFTTSATWEAPYWLYVNLIFLKKGKNELIHKTEIESDI